LKKLVYILIPAYNADKWIDETINSAINHLWLGRLGVKTLFIGPGSKRKRLSGAACAASVVSVHKNISGIKRTKFPGYTSTGE
jgi:hypothetical protein